MVCERDLQIHRLMENRGLTEADSTALINVQMSLDKKAEKADYVLENSGNIQDLEKQVLDVYDQLITSRFHWKIRFGLGIAFGGLCGIIYVVAKTCGAVFSADSTRNVSQDKITYTLVSNFKFLQ